MYEKLRPWLFRIDPEHAHALSAFAARFGERYLGDRLRERFTFEHDSLRTWLLNRPFQNPIGLAAGFDKNAKLLSFWPLLGFGYAEAGSVSAKPSRGNPRPRAFRLPEDEALINRMGLNNQGVDQVWLRLRAAAQAVQIPIGVNIAKTNDPGIEDAAAIEDYVQTFRLVAPHVAYVAVNISCPNTRDGTTFEDPIALDALLGALLAARSEMRRKTPLLVKLAPPYSDRVVFDSMVEQVLQVSMQHEVDGFIASNTTADRPNLTTSPERLKKIGGGGLSGPPIRSRSTNLVRYIYRKTEGRLPIIGVGGVDSAEAAYEKIRAGASLVQLYTGLVYHGPGIVRTIKEGLVRLLEEDGFAQIGEAVGAGH